MVSFSVLENKQVRRSSFSVLFMPCNQSFIDQASSVKMAGYWPRSLFAFLWTETKSIIVGETKSIIVGFTLEAKLVSSNHLTQVYLKISSST